MSHTLDCNEGMIYGDACSCAPPAETPAPTIIGRTIISESGAALTVTELHLSEETKRALSTNGVRIPPVARDAALHDFDVIDGLRADLAAAERNTELRSEWARDAEKRLDAANEEIARLKAQNNHIADERDRNVADRVATAAKLGRAVTALREARFDVSWERTPHSIALAARIDAILADADSKAAGEALAIIDARRGTK